MGVRAVLGGSRGDKEGSERVGVLPLPLLSSVLCALGCELAEQTFLEKAAEMQHPRPEAAIWKAEF